MEQDGRTVCEDVSIAELAREHMRLRHGAKLGVRKIKSKKDKCCMCNREMECPEEEQGPKYCWRCSDHHDIGSPWD